MKKLLALTLTVLMLAAVMVPLANAATSVPYETRYWPTVDDSLKSLYTARAGKFGSTSWKLNPVTEKNSVGNNGFKITANDDGTITATTPDNGTDPEGVLSRGRSAAISLSTNEKVSIGESGKSYNPVTNPGYSVTFKLSEKDLPMNSDGFDASVSVCFTQNKIVNWPGELVVDETTGDIVPDQDQVSLYRIGVNAMRGAGTAEGDDADTNKSVIVQSNPGIYVLFIMGKSTTNAPQYIYIIRDDGYYINSQYDGWIGERWGYENVKAGGGRIVNDITETITVEVRPDPAQGYTVLINGYDMSNSSAGERKGNDDNSSNYGDDHEVDLDNHPLDSRSFIDFNRYTKGQKVYSPVKGKNVTIKHDTDIFGANNDAYVNLTVLGSNGTQIPSSTDTYSFRADFTLLALDGGKPTVGVHEHQMSEDWIKPEITYPCTPYEEYKGCTICGKTIETRIVPASVSHDYGDWEDPAVKYPCVPYEHTRTCKICNIATETATVPASAPHDFGEDIVVSAPTIAEGGKIANICSVCHRIEYEDTDVLKDDGSCDKFTDLKNDWTRPYIIYGVQNGIISGMSPTTVAPNGNATRAQFVMMLYNLAGKPDVSTIKNTFKDVPENAWFRDAVVWAADKGVTSGTAPGYFSPNNNVTREQLIKLLRNYATTIDNTLDGQILAYPPITETLNGFKDKGDVSAWALEDVKWGVQFGITNGSGGNILPKSPATRAQVVGMLQNYAHVTKLAAIEYSLTPTK